MFRPLLLLWAAAVVSASAAFAQPSPYVSYQGREIKALSEEQRAAYLGGDGMGFALAGELNGYPGPRHVLELADELQLTQEQRLGTRSVFDAMRADALRLGAAIVAGEHTLDSLFAGRYVTDDALEQAVTQLGRLEGELRYVHLSAHLAMMNLLSPDQLERYAALRGYGGNGHRQHHGRGR